MSCQIEYLTIAIKMAVILVVMIGCLWCLSVYLKKIMKISGGKKNSRYIKVLENCYVGEKKSISLVKVPGSVLILGITGDKITFLSKIDPAEIKGQDEK